MRKKSFQMKPRSYPVLRPFDPEVIELVCSGPNSSPELVIFDGVILEGVFAVDFTMDTAWSTHSSKVSIVFSVPLKLWSIPELKMTFHPKELIVTRDGVPKSLSLEEV